MDTGYNGQNLYAAPPAPQTEPGRKTGSFGRGLLVGLLIGLAIAVTIGVVVFIQLRNLIPSDGLINSHTIRKINLISDVIDTYYYDYQDSDITAEDKTDGLYRGLVDSLGDAYATYYSEEELAAELDDNEGIYYGIGAYVSLGEDGFPFLSGIMEGTPAERAGLRSGDVITKVDGVTTGGMTLDEVVSMIKGPEGTKVHLTVYREGERENLEIDVIRGKVETQTVSHEMLEDDIGYIYISHFDYVTIDQFARAYQDIRDQGAKGLIIDLRGNPGGLVASVVGIAQQILPEGLVFYEMDSDGKKMEYRCDGSRQIDIPLVVLIDEYSASASEILSGAIRDHGIGTLVGKNTYGKGIVQDIKQLSDGSAVRLTIGAYYLPNGDNIQGTGIAPDVEVDLDVDAYYDEDIDTQLDKGIEVLKSQMH